MQARKTGVSMVGWFAEDPFDLSSNLSNQDLYDVVFSNEVSSVTEYEKGKAKHLPLAASDDLCKFPVRDDLWYDVCIGGTAWPERVRFCRQLIDRLPDLRWKVILATNDVIRDYDFPAPKAETDVRYCLRDLCRIYNHSAITINLRRIFSLDRPGESLSPPPRVFETALAGTAQIVQTCRGDTLGQYFLLGTEVETFRDVEECVEKIRAILADLNRRRELALAAQKRAVSDHPYAKRIVPILRWIEQHGSTPTRSGHGRNLLICVHNNTEQRPFGGVEILTEELARYLSVRWNVYLLYPSKKERKWYLLNLGSSTRSEIDLKMLSRYDTLSAYSPYEAMKFKEIMLRNDISLVYFQHLFNYPLLLPISAAELGIPFVVSLHDYYAVCHKYNLIDISGKYCHPDKIPVESCDVCLGSSHGLKLGAQTRRRDLMAEVLQRASGIHCVSHWQRELIASIYPEFRERMQIIEPGCEDKLRGKTASDHKKLGVVVPGNIGFYKGAQVLLRVATYFADVLADKIEFLIPFTVQSPQKDLLAKLQNVRLGTETCNPGEQLEIYREADVALFPSIWPETYLIALSEAWRMGVPAIVTDLGAPSDRVQDGVNGWKVSPNDAGQIIHLLGRILDNPEILDKMRDEIKKIQVRSQSGYHREVEAFIERTLDENAAVPTSPHTTESQIAWLKAQTSGRPAMILPWGRTRVDQAKRVLPVKAWRYLQTFGPQRLLAATLVYLGRRLGYVSPDPDRSAQSG